MLCCPSPYKSSTGARRQSATASHENYQNKFKMSSENKENSGEDQQPQYVYLVTDEGGNNTTGNLTHLADHQLVITAPPTYHQEETEEAEDASTTIWTKCNNALSDLLAFLVKKYNVDEVMDSKMKSLHWDRLIEEFHRFTGQQMLVSKQQITRKWHNWKQYNKSKKKPHPFALVGNLTEDNVRAKCQLLLSKLAKDGQDVLTDPMGTSEDIDVNLQVNIECVNFRLIT